MIMQKFLSSLFVFVLFGMQASAQQFAVSGRTVDDTEKSAPLSLVKVELLRPDSTRVAVVTSGEDGTFRIEAKTAGKYIVRASFIGCETKTLDVQLTRKKPVVALKDVVMPQAGLRLSEAQVTALSRMMTVKADTLMFHTNALRLPPGASLAALMKELPGVSIDKDGNLTFQGKAVNQILVDGKPFFGDVSTALANMPTEAVQDVKVYEKSDENKEFRRELDTEKATVVDLKIKEEYKTTWMANVDLGGGTDERYIGKLFATNFTDRRRTAVYAQMNNISQNQRVDENGNWSYWGGLNGIYTYRKAGTMLQWDNGKGNREGGNLRVNGNVDMWHNDQTTITDNNNETFLGGGKSQFGYAHGQQYAHRAGLEARANVVYNLDSLNRLDVRTYYSYNRNDSKHHSYSSIYQEKPVEMDDPAGSLLADELPDDIRQKALYARRSNSLSEYNNHFAQITASYTHLFKKQGRGMDFHFYAHMSRTENENDALLFYRYFHADAPRPELTDRQYVYTPRNGHSFTGGLSYYEPLGKHLRWSVAYNFDHGKNDNREDRYQLDRYDYYANPQLPVGFRPTPGDSLEFVRNIENSNNYDEYQNQHSLRTRLQGTWDKVEWYVYPSLNLFNENLYYRRGTDFYHPDRTVLGLGLYSSLKYKFNPQNFLEMSYRGNTVRPSQMELLPIRDTSNPMVETVNNPDLKTGWSNRVSLFGRFFNDKRGDTYSVYGFFSNSSNSVVSTVERDPVTGYSRYGKTNVNGNHEASFSLSTEQPLDTARHWTLSASSYTYYSHATAFVGTAAGGLGLSTINTYSPTARLGLRYRKDIWSISLNGMWEGTFSRYRETPQYNQNGYVYEAILTPQVDLPFGMKINASLIFYTRKGYKDPMLNHDQWILNASISQSFLKNKALTLQLEATDLLQQRTSEFSHLSAEAHTFSRTKCFLSYVMLHAIYRFNIGGKK